MIMDRKTKEALAQPIIGFRLPRFNELPDVGLYLDQVTKYINGFLAPLEGVELTSSMVSNYVKKKLIAKPVKKQYTAEQIAYLFFIVFAKNLVSMENIGLLIEMQVATYTLPVAFDYMCAQMEESLQVVFGLKESVETIGVTHSDEKDILTSLISSAATVIYLNACFQHVRKLRMPEKAGGARG